MDDDKYLEHIRTELARLREELREPTCAFTVFAEEDSLRRKWKRAKIRTLLAERKHTLAREAADKARRNSDCAYKKLTAYYRKQENPNG